MESLSGKFSLNASMSSKWQEISSYTNLVWDNDLTSPPSKDCYDNKLCRKKWSQSSKSNMDDDLMEKYGQITQILFSCQ